MKYTRLKRSSLCNYVQSHIVGVAWMLGGNAYIWKSRQWTNLPNSWTFVPALPCRPLISEMPTFATCIINFRTIKCFQTDLWFWQINKSGNHTHSQWSSLSQLSHSWSTLLLYNGLLLTDELDIWVSFRVVGCSSLLSLFLAHVSPHFGTDETSFTSRPYGWDTYSCILFNSHLPK